MSAQKLVDRNSGRIRIHDLLWSNIATRFFDVDTSMGIDWMLSAQNGFTEAGQEVRLSRGEISKALD